MSPLDPRARIAAESCWTLPVAWPCGAGHSSKALGTVSRRDAWVTLAALALLIGWEATGWDRAMARWFGNAGGFALRDAWLTRTLLHEGGRWLTGGALAVLALDAMRPLWPGPSRRERWYWFAVTVGALLLVPAIKQLSQTSCPWDLAEFGGHAAYVPHWVFSTRDAGPGHCFPSGHAVAAFAFLSLHFLWRPHRPILARWLLSGVVALGLLFGGTQLARGAHFPSHTFWSAWLCWILCVAAAALQERRRRAAGLLGSRSR